jgi:hypothetical protein
MQGWDITMQFLYSHCGTPRNEAVDAYVDSCLPDLYSSQCLAPIPFAAIKAEVRRSSRAHYKEALGPKYRTVDLKLMKGKLTRSEATLAARLRTGQHPKVGKMHWKYLKLCPGSMCRCCGLVEETIDHIYDECNAQVVVSLKALLNFTTRDILYNDPKKGIEFMEALAAQMKWKL